MRGGVETFWMPTKNTPAAWVKNFRMHGAYTTWEETFGSGATIGTEVIPLILQPIPLGQAQDLAELSEAAAGTSLPGTAAPRHGLSLAQTFATIRWGCASPCNRLTNGDDEMRGLGLASSDIVG